MSKLLKHGPRPIIIAYHERELKSCHRDRYGQLVNFCNLYPRSAEMNGKKLVLKIYNPCHAYNNNLKLEATAGEIHFDFTKFSYITYLKTVIVEVLDSSTDKLIKVELTLNQFKYSHKGNYVIIPELEEYFDCIDRLKRDNLVYDAKSKIKRGTINYDRNLLRQMVLEEYNQYDYLPRNQQVAWRKIIFYNSDYQTIFNNLPFGKRVKEQFGHVTYQMYNEIVKYYTLLDGLKRDEKGYIILNE